MDKKLFLENFAKNILAKNNLIDNYDMKKSESPDFIDKTKTIGLEITIANNSIPYTMMIIKGQNINNAKNRKNYIKKIGGKVIKKSINQNVNNEFILQEDNNNFYASFDIDVGFNLINNEIEKKIKKLQNYKECKEYRLFIFTPSLFINTTENIKKLELEKEIIYIKNIMNKNIRKFNVIYFFTFDKIYILNIDLGYFKIKDADVDEKILLESDK